MWSGPDPHVTRLAVPVGVRCRVPVLRAPAVTGWHRPCLRDRLTAVGVGAVGGIKPARSLGESRKLLAGLLQGFDVGIDLFEVGLEQPNT